MPTSLNNVSPLERYGHNLTLLAQQGAFSPLVGYEGQVADVFESLLRRVKWQFYYNPLIVDLDGRAPWPVAAEVIRRMAIGDAPELLPIKRVIALDYEALLAPLSDERLADTEGFSKPPEPEEDELSLAQSGAEDTFAHLLEKCFPHGRVCPPLQDVVPADIIHHRLKTVFMAVQETEGQVLLFVDHLHRLLGGEWESYPIHAYDLLKPVLARGKIQLMGVCTLDQYRQYVRDDALLRRCFQAVYMPDAQEEVLQRRTQGDLSSQ